MPTVSPMRFGRNWEPEPLRPKLGQLPRYPPAIPADQSYTAVEVVPGRGAYPPGRFVLLHQQHKDHKDHDRHYNTPVNGYCNGDSCPGRSFVHGPASFIGPQVVARPAGPSAQCSGPISCITASAPFVRRRAQSKSPGTLRTTAHYHFPPKSNVPFATRGLSSSSPRPHPRPTAHSVRRRAPSRAGRGFSSTQSRPPAHQIPIRRAPAASCAT